MRYIIILILVSNYSWSQSTKTIIDIDSSLMRNPGIENFRYYYGSNSNNIFDFRMDTSSGKLTRFIYNLRETDTIEVEYYFIENYLVKVNYQKIKGTKRLTVGTYYFSDNKLIHKTGKNLKLSRKGIFQKIAPHFFKNQLEYIYYQYEFLNPSKNRYQKHVPEILRSVRDRLDKHY